MQDADKCPVTLAFDSLRLTKMEENKRILFFPREFTYPLKPCAERSHDSLRCICISRKTTQALEGLFSPFYHSESGTWQKSLNGVAGDRRLLYIFVVVSVMEAARGIFLLELLNFKNVGASYRLGTLKGIRVFLSFFLSAPLRGTAYKRHINKQTDSLICHCEA